MPTLYKSNRQVYPLAQITHTIGVSSPHQHNGTARTLLYLLHKFMVRKIPENRWDRHRLLFFQELKPYQGKQFYCKALGCSVKVTRKSIAETAYHASRSIVSTKLALRLPYIIQNAKILQPYLPTKQGQKQTKVMFFQHLISLTCGIRGLGTALLMVGKRKNGDVYEYCITDFRLHQGTKKRE